MVNFMVNVSFAFFAINGVRGTLGQQKLTKDHIKAILLNCLDILGALTIYNAKNETELDQAGGIKLVLSTLQQNINNEKVVLACCYIIHLLRNASSKQTVISQGGIKLLNQILDAYHKKSAPVLEKATYSLRSLCTAFPEELVKAGIIQVLISLMKSHIEYVEILEQAIATLSGLSLINPNVKAKPSERHELMIQHGLVPLILNILASYVNEKNQLIQWSCRILHNLTFGRDNIKKMVVENGGIAILLKVMQQRTDDAEIIANAAPVLTTIAANKNYKNLIKKAGGLEIATKAMELKLSDDATKNAKSLQLFDCFLFSFNQNHSNSIGNINF